MAIGGKPFSLQAPEQIAKEYGGDKQKIMQAAQMGVVDPTAAVMAGMFIDRIRTAQTAEQAAPSTVAQEVFTPPAPPPMQGAPGIGAPPMAPPQTAPQSGGLEALPVPDAMFSGGEVGMAGGGMVSFAAGGNTDFHQLIARLESNNRDYYDDGRPVISSAGARYGMQVMPATARDPGFGVAPARADTPEEYNRVGREYADMLLGRYGGNQTDALVAYNWGPGNADRWVANGRNINALPDETRQYLARAGRSAGATPSGGTRAPAMSGGLPLSMEDFRTLTQAPEIDYAGSIANMSGLLEGILPDTSTIDELMTSLRERNAPEEVKEQRSQDLWGALADFGFRWASSGNLAESAGETFSGLRETIEGRREQEFEDLTRMIQLEGMNIERAMVPVTMGIEAAEKQAERESDASSLMGNYALQMGNTQLAGNLRKEEAVLDAALNPPAPEGGITPAAMRSAQDAARSDISEYISMGVDPNSGITPGDPQLVAVLQRFAPNGGALTPEQFAAAVEALAMVRLGIAPAGAGTGGAASAPVATAPMGQLSREGVYSGFSAVPVS
jgi:soluble lytic murein transglycosylase